MKIEFMQMPDFKTYSDEDHDGFVNLVNDVHAEFGYSYDPVLDADLADPPAFYRHIWVARMGASVVGSVALTSAKDGVTMLKRMYLRPEFRGQGLGRNLLRTAIETAVREGWKKSSWTPVCTSRTPSASMSPEASGWTAEMERPCTTRKN
ncbi:GNAT family N-acetyltransferase [Pseudarthrobacter sp. Fe7]|nr:GNAT family N-acetyltransferase [Pseudarthrobacter sp. Fe7]